MTTLSYDRKLDFQRSLREKLMFGAKPDLNEDILEYKTSHGLSSMPWDLKPCFAASMTIRPSPDPISTRLPDLPLRALRTLSTCLVVAGTYGRQNFLRAGVTNGRQIALRATATPPEINHVIN